MSKFKNIIENVFVYCGAIIFRSKDSKKLHEINNDKLMSLGLALLNTDLLKCLSMDE